MKRIIFLLTMLVFSAITSLGQISLENTYSGVSAAYIKLPVAGYKFYVMDVANSQCRLYNTDHSLWKTINLSLPANYYLYDIRYVTENLFNTDNSIEVIYVSYMYNSTLAYYTYDTRIASETGTVLLSIPGGGYSDIYPSQNGSKLFVWVYDYSLTPSTVNTMVYAIPGQITTDVAKIQVKGPGPLGKAFPNPASDVVTIPFTLPENVTQAELKLFSANGTLVRSFSIDHSFENLILQTNDLVAGMYLYRIESANFKSDGYKLTISE